MQGGGAPRGRLGCALAPVTHYVGARARIARRYAGRPTQL
ncbi:hypothetical protein C7S13_6139 [Burkholderia cepacia]|nr:hypothetical protein [Burkholderia cepacia]MDW9248573.1 hypothetical protein [Burkholderia cepacia]QOH37375.1 hypothetical protein C7S14_0266 [Burkholderia cepacia]